MLPAEIVCYVRAQPFRPFRIRMVSGCTFDIDHPKMVQVGKRDLMISQFVSDT